MRRKLSDILGNGSTNPRDLQAAWTNAPAAPEYEVLPSGPYMCRVCEAKLDSSRVNQTPYYAMAFQVEEGPYTGRKVWHDYWLTVPAMPYTKRELQKFGILGMEQLDAPLPDNFKCELVIGIDERESGRRRNVVRRVVRVWSEAPTSSPFAPKEEPDVSIPSDQKGADK